MAAPTRIYIVRNATADIDAETGKSLHRLVRASHPSHALRHVAADSFEVKVASQDDGSSPRTWGTHFLHPVDSQQSSSRAIFYRHDGGTN